MDARSLRDLRFFCTCRVRGSPCRHYRCCYLKKRIFNYVDFESSNLPMGTIELVITLLTSVDDSTAVDEAITVLLISERTNIMRADS